MSRTRLCNSAATVALPFNTRETVAVDTPAARATSMTEIAFDLLRGALFFVSLVNLHPAGVEAHHRACPVPNTITRHVEKWPPAGLGPSPVGPPRVHVEPLSHPSWRLLKTSRNS